MTDAEPDIRYTLTADGEPLNTVADRGLAIRIARAAASRTGAFTRVQAIPELAPGRVEWSSVTHGGFSRD